MFDDYITRLNAALLCRASRLNCPTSAGVKGWP